MFKLCEHDNLLLKKQVSSVLDYIIRLLTMLCIAGGSERLLQYWFSLSRPSSSYLALGLCIAGILIRGYCQNHIRAFDDYIERERTDKKYQELKQYLMQDLQIDETQAKQIAFHCNFNIKLR